MSYTKQTWTTGDIITAEKLNHMEDGIANIDLPSNANAEVGDVLTKGENGNEWTTPQAGGEKLYKILLSCSDNPRGNITNVTFNGILDENESRIDPLLENDIFLNYNKNRIVVSLYNETTAQAYDLIDHLAVKLVSFDEVTHAPNLVKLVFPIFANGVTGSTQTTDISTKYKAGNFLVVSPVNTVEAQFKRLDWEPLYNVACMPLIIPK